MRRPWRNFGLARGERVSCPAIDVMLCATALAQPGRVTVLTSDIDDMTMLTTDHPRVTAEKV
ncbi:hypothetical protein [Streptomyces jumonjinensis]|uniref:hypothetical protein n=1 Tax=Streptomyces jumonjinensis TaxID=1945 RepID=UPI0037A4F078